MALARALAAEGQRVTAPRGTLALQRPGWREFFGSLPAGAPLRGVVHLGAVSDSSPGAVESSPAQDAEQLAASALALAQGLQDAGAAPAAGLWFVTRGGQVLDGERGGGLAGAPLWGFARTAALELTGIPVRLVDLDPEGAGSPEVLAGELLHPDRETEIAYREGRRRVPRLVRLRPAADPAGGEASARRVRGDRSYLVTGAFGGIGLEVARWLLDEGAGAVVLNGRREPGAQAAAEVARLRDRGAEVRVEIADVTDGEAVARLVAGIGPAAGLPPLGGVIHGAGVLSDAALAHQDASGFDRVLRPKVRGGWHLHRATLGVGLDLFVVLSSFTAVAGNAGQANYAAANAFLDQLAAHRRARGLPGQTIQWGAWSQVGEAEARRGALEDRLGGAGGGGVTPAQGARGIGWLTPAQGLRALGRLLRDDVGSAAVVPVDWGMFNAAAPAAPALFSELVESAGRERHELAGGDLAARVREARPADRERLLVEFVRREAGSVLRLAAPPAPHVGFFDLGMDSLMAVELRNRVNRGLAGEYVAPGSVVFDFPSAARMGRHLLDALAPAGDEEERPPETPPAGEAELDGLVAEIRAELGDGDA